MSLQLSRYEQHIELPEVGIPGQKKIYASKILIVGVGGLGCPIAQYLTSAGVGTIGIVDGDEVSLTNLHRQILFSQEDIGLKKTERAKEKLSKLSCGQTINTYAHFLDEGNAREIISGYDLVIDATDNHQTRLLLNETCLRLGKPWIYGALYRFEGQFMVINGGLGPCYSCVFPNITKESALPTCKTSGVLAPVPGTIGTLQALEALKFILQMNTQVGRLNVIDLLTYQMKAFSVSKNSQCKVCGNNVQRQFEASQQ